MLFVTQESGKIPSGVLAVLEQLCGCWPESDHITIMMNPMHSGDLFLRQKLGEKNNLYLQKIPSFLADDRFNIRLLSLPRVLRILIRSFFLPVTVLQSLILLGWLTTWMRKNRVSAILSHNGGWPGGGLNRWVIYAGFLAAVPWRVLVIHNTPQIPDFFIRKFLFNLTGYFIGCLATRIVTVSHACRESLEQKGNFGQPLDVIYNGILSDPLTIPDDGMRRPPWEKKYPTIAFVGELHPRKGVHVLLDALQYVNTACELVLIGNGVSAYTAKIEAMASQSNHSVIFLGYRDDVQDLYRWIDIVVLPSLNFESFGMVIIEAMRASVPAICSDFGGMKEVVVDGETGLVVPAGDSCALAQAITRLLGDENLRVRMGEAGYIRMKRHFSSLIMTGNYVQLFHLQ